MITYGLLGAFLIMNLIGYLVVFIDKRKAIKGKRRIPEKIIWRWSFCGGAIGAYLSMKRFRHKTQHRSFMVGVPFVIFLNLLVLSGLLYVLNRYV